MPTNHHHKGGRSLGRLFGHRKGSRRKSLSFESDVSFECKDGVVGDRVGVTREEIVWDPQGRILNWKTVVSKIQKQVRSTKYSLVYCVQVSICVGFCRGLRRGIGDCCGHSCWECSVQSLRMRNVVLSGNGCRMYLLDLCLYVKR